jgi:hypothetical protein
MTATGKSRCSVDRVAGGVIALVVLQPHALSVALPQHSALAFGSQQVACCAVEQQLVCKLLDMKFVSLFRTIRWRSYAPIQTRSLRVIG